MNASQLRLTRGVFVRSDKCQCHWREPFSKQGRRINTIMVNTTIKLIASPSKVLSRSSRLKKLSYVPPIAKGNIENNTYTYIRFPTCKLTSPVTGPSYIICTNIVEIGR